MGKTIATALLGSTYPDNLKYTYEGYYGYLEDT